jgi:hypothetical protein
MRHAGGWQYNVSSPADPKEKVKHETFAQGSIAVGRPGRHIGVCRCPENYTAIGTGTAM